MLKLQGTDPLMSPPIVLPFSIDGNSSWELFAGFGASFLVWLKYNYLLTLVANEHVLRLLSWGAASCCGEGTAWNCVLERVWCRHTVWPQGAGGRRFTAKGDGFPPAHPCQGEAWGKALPWVTWHQPAHCQAPRSGCGSQLGLDKPS